MSPGDSRRQLILSALAVVSTANAWRALARRSFLALPGAVSGMRSDLPLHVLGASGARLAWAGARGRLRGRDGALAVALAGVAGAGLLALNRSLKQTRPILDRALDEALGPASAAKEPGVEVDVPPGIVRVLRSHHTDAGTCNVEYGPHGWSNRLDVWRRPDLPADAGAPVLLQIPGGAWIFGYKQGQAYPLLHHFVERGWVCVSMSYRVAPWNPWPAQIVDVKRAIAWVKANIADHGGDPEFVALTGGSAGGHLTALAALSAGDAAYQPGFEDLDTAVRAAVPFYGVYDWVDEGGAGSRMLDMHLERTVVRSPRAAQVDVYRAASPVARAHADAPPFFVLHGDNDPWAPVEQARALVAALRAVSRQPVAYAELPHAMHAFDVLAGVRANECARAVERFLDAVRARSAPQPTGG